MGLHCSGLLFYCSSVSNDRREAEQAPTISPEAASHRDVSTTTSQAGMLDVRDVLVAGGLRGFTTRQMFPERAA